jgi:predicted metal-dependent HD superfamily phosphohydrolase
MNSSPCLVSVWEAVCSRSLHLTEKLKEEILETVITKYSEPHRHYHTLRHIDHLLLLAQQNRDRLRDFNLVVTAIIFHDIIYDPQSKTNEEDSAIFFKSSFSPFLDEAMCNKAVEYILATKLHKVSDSDDGDLKLFIDFDMSILGADRIAYTEYAAQIRREYIHVEHSAYCHGRAAFLKSTIAAGDRIFATDEFFDQYESQAKLNMEWEAEELSKGIIPSL